MTTSSRLSGCSDRPAVSARRPGHQFRGQLWIQGLLRRIAISVREARRVIRGIVLVGGAHGVQEFVGNHHVVCTVHFRRRKCIHHADAPFGETQGMRHAGGQRRVVIQHEYADVLGLPNMPAGAPRPIPQAQAPQRGREGPGLYRALRRDGRQFGPEPGSDRLGCLQMKLCGFACKESINGLEAVNIDRGEIGARFRAVVRCNRVDRDVQRVMPAGTQVSILPRGERDQQQHQQQDQDAQHLERPPPRRVCRSRRHSPDSTRSSLSSPSSVV